MEPERLDNHVPRAGEPFLGSYTYSLPWASGAGMYSQSENAKVTGSCLCRDRADAGRKQGGDTGARLR